jgi:general secretion pathway protein M
MRSLSDALIATRKSGQAVFLAVNNSHTALRTRFVALSPREQRWMLAAVCVLSLLLLIGIGVLPAVRSLRASPQVQQQVNAQQQALQLLQVRAQALQALPSLDQTAAVDKLQAAISLLGGNAEISVGDQRVNLVLRSTPAKALAEWLARARAEAHAVSIEARLTREGPAEGALWSGTLVMSLPPR